MPHERVPRSPGSVTGPELFEWLARLRRIFSPATISGMERNLADAVLLSGRFELARVRTPQRRPHRAKEAAKSARRRGRSPLHIAPLLFAGAHSLQVLKFGNRPHDLVQEREVVGGSLAWPVHLFLFG